MSVTDVCIVIFLNIYRVHGQACTWTWLQPSGSDLTWTKSVGAVATFTASVNDILSNGDLLTWKMNFTELSVEQYDETANSFNSFLEDARGVRTSFETPSDGRGHIYTMRFPTVNGVTLDLQNYEFTVTSQGCVSGATSTSVRLLVSNCDLNAFSSEANATDMTDCGYNCTREFTCLNDPSLSFQATCQADATWNETTPTSQDRCKFCNANDLGPSVTEATSAQAGVDQTKKFNCACPTGVESFVAECQTGLVWNYTATTIPCHAACDASEVTFASPGSDSFLCGVQRFTCNSHRVCEPTIFDLECAANGTWLSIDENQCSKGECCDESCIKKKIAMGLAATFSLEIIALAAYLGYLHQSVYHVFKTWLPWIVLMPILTAIAVADWILIGISETENTIPPNATLTIGVVLAVVTTTLLLVALAAHCRFKKSNKTKIGSSDGVTQNNGKVMSDAANSDR